MLLVVVLVVSVSWLFFLLSHLSLIELKVLLPTCYPTDSVPPPKKNLVFFSPFFQRPNFKNSPHFLNKEMGGGGWRMGQSNLSRKR